MYFFVGFHKIKIHETAQCTSHSLQTLAAGINMNVFRSSVSPSWLQEALQRFAWPVLSYKKLLLFGPTHCPSGKLKALKDSSLEETEGPSVLSVTVAGRVWHCKSRSSLRFQ